MCHLDREKEREKKMFLSDQRGCGWVGGNSEKVMKVLFKLFQLQQSYSTESIHFLFLFKERVHPHLPRHFVLVIHILLVF